MSVADADGAQLLGYLMHEIGERELVLRGILPIHIATPVTFEDD